MLEPALIVKPLTFVPACAPFRTIKGAPLKPGCVVPSMVTGVVMVGSADCGLIVCTPVPMRKSMTFGPGLMLLLSRMASRNEPSPASSVFVTVQAASVFMGLAMQVAKSSRSSKGRTVGRKTGGRPALVAGDRRRETIRASRVRQVVGNIVVLLQ